MSNFFSPLQDELIRLEAELKQSPIYRRREAVKAALQTLADAYKGEERSDAASILDDEDTVSLPAMPFQPPIRITREGSKSALVVEMAETLFRETGRRFRSGELLKSLVDKGFNEVQGKKPSAAIASIMSHHPLFDNNFDAYGVGYGLKDWSTSSSDFQQKQNFVQTDADDREQLYDNFQKVAATLEVRKEFLEPMETPS